MTLLSSSLFDIVGELSIEERNRELSEKEEHIKQAQKIIQDKSDSIAALQSDIELLQVSLIISLGFFGFKDRTVEENSVHRTIS